MTPFEDYVIKPIMAFFYNRPKLTRTKLGYYILGANLIAIVIVITI